MTNPLVKVLYVEDQPAVGAVILLELQRARVEVTTAHNAERGLELARKTRFDLILLDVMLREASGFEVCRLLKSDDRLKDVPVIFFTGVPTPKDRMEALRLGAVAYLNKGSEMSQLAERILSEVELARTVASGNGAKDRATSALPVGGQN